MIEIGVGQREGRTGPYLGIRPQELRVSHRGDEFVVVELDEFEPRALGHPGGDFVGDVGRGHAQVDHVGAVHAHALRKEKALHRSFLARCALDRFPPFRRNQNIPCTYKITGILCLLQNQDWDGYTGWLDFHNRLF